VKPDPERYAVLEEIISEMSELVIPEKKGIVYQIKE
jgi:hypothetical protein